MKKNLWIVSEVFYPDETATSYILTKVAEQFAEAFDVHVICGPLDADCRKSNQLLDPQIHIHRCNYFAWNKNNLFTRVFRFFCISFVLIFSSFKQIKQGEDVLIVTNPAPMLLLFPLLKRWKKYRLTILVHDVFPENAIAAGIIKNKNSLFYNILKHCFDKAYARADRLIVIGRDMKEVMFEKIAKYRKNTIPNIEIIENWADIKHIKPSSFDRNAFLGLDCSNKIILQYAGNLGRVQGLMDFLQCFYESRNPNLHLCIWGEGAIEKELRQYVKEHNIPNISFHGVYAREMQQKILNSCDLAIVTLANGMYGLGVPSKSYNIMAAGKPILYIGNPASEIAQTIHEKKLGISFPNEEKQLMTFLTRLTLNDLPYLRELGRNARISAETDYAQSVILQKFSSSFTKI